MNLPSVLLLLICAFGLSFTLTGFMRRYALNTRMLDIPNARSSHSQPTPRGGGVAFVFTFNLLLSWVTINDHVAPALGWTVIATGCVVAAVGYLDDRRPLPARWRFIVHTGAAVMILWSTHGIPPVPIFGQYVDLGWIGVVLAGAYIVWMINLYNFMDGIDGIAGVEAITVTLGAALCWWLATGTTQWIIPALLGTCVAGFLAWNLPPAKIFMGDAGSSSLGAVLGALSLWTAQQTAMVFWCWFILFGCFMVDATTTLVRRVRRGGAFNVAHRCHAYQYASRKHGAHAVVTIAFAAINCLWLLPIAIAVAVKWIDGVSGAILAYAPLVGLAFHYKAGDAESQTT